MLRRADGGLTVPMICPSGEEFLAEIPSFSAFFPGLARLGIAMSVQCGAFTATDRKAGVGRVVVRHGSGIDRSKGGNVVMSAALVDDDFGFGKREDVWLVSERSHGTVMVW